MCTEIYAMPLWAVRIICIISSDIIMKTVDGVPYKPEYDESTPASSDFPIASPILVNGTGPLGVRRITIYTVLPWMLIDNMFFIICYRELTQFRLIPKTRCDMLVAQRLIGSRFHRHYHFVSTESQLTEAILPLVLWADGSALCSSGYEWASDRKVEGWHVRLLHQFVAELWMYFHFQWGSKFGNLVIFIDSSKICNPETSFRYG